MGRKTVLVDDLDGKELPDGTSPVKLSLGRTTYNLYLSETNHGKLLKALEPYISDAEVASSISAFKAAASTGADKDKMKKVRTWAIETGFKYKDAKGEDKTLGERGRIPQEVVEAYDAAN